MDDDDMLRAAMTEGRHVGGALDALAAWLLAEDAYTRGGVPDEVLNFLQDHVDHLLGPHATGVAGEFVREHVLAGDDLADLARDRSALSDLLALIEGKRRRGFAFQWRAGPPADPDGSHRPEALLVMAEYSVGDPVWDRPHGSGDPVALSELGVSDSLRQRLRAWNRTYERWAFIDGWASSEGYAAWVRRGLSLAQELGRELPDIEVRYFHADDDRPLPP